MTIFSNLLAAQREGFKWLDFVPELQMHLVELEYTRQDGKRCRVLALARPEKTDYCSGKMSS